MARESPSHLPGRVNGAAEEVLRLPRAPVFGWASLHPGKTGDGIDKTLTNTVYTTSGRAALYQALLQLRLTPGTPVLVPNYHCPTMVAPIICAGLRPQFFAIDENGLPDLSEVMLAGPLAPAAIIVAHYFGLPRSLAHVRAWCDRHAVVLIEDCAHSFFGQAGDRPVGHWGDFATASVSKFLPVPEAGLLGSARRTLQPLQLKRRSVRDQLKGCFDVVETGTRYQRFPGLNTVLRSAFRWKGGTAFPLSGAGAVDPQPDADSMLRGCDMGRIASSPLLVARVLTSALPRARIVERRRANFARFLERLDGVDRARPLFRTLEPGAAPYVFPLWVEDADAVYRALRHLSAPVFRWDHLWPATPQLHGDHGRRWSRHVLQLLCHQDLDMQHVDLVADTIRSLVQPGSSYRLAA